MPSYACMELVMISVCWGENGGKELVMMPYLVRSLVLYFVKCKESGTRIVGLWT